MKNVVIVNLTKSHSPRCGTFWTAEVPELPNCNTRGWRCKTRRDALSRACDAIKSNLAKTRVPEFDL